jgi:hypothetical protein
MRDGWPLCRPSCAIVLSLACAVLVPEAHAQVPARFTDPQDGRLDMSDYLLRHRGLLPVPLVITEPAVGYGAGAAVAYFSQSFEERAEASRARGEAVTPPDITVAAAFKTENGTWAAGLGHLGYWDHDRWRYLGALGKAELRLDYYSVGGEASAYLLEAAALIQQLIRRVGPSNWFLGARYTYVGTESSFVRERPAEIAPRQLELSVGKLGLVADYDSRDNTFTPNRGVFFEAEAAFARRAFGSDASFDTLYARGYSWHPVDRWVLGVRGDARLSRGDVPFYAQPYVVLRGIPAARYQDRHALMGEAEARFNLDSRWALVAFGGFGKAYGRRQAWSEAKAVGAGGVGFRYLVARKLGLYAGLDVARGPEDPAIYVQVGGAWK